jgi:hypothetical protein
MDDFLADLALPLCSYLNFWLECFNHPQDGYCSDAIHLE